MLVDQYRQAAKAEASQARIQLHEREAALTHATEQGRAQTGLISQLRAQLSLATTSHADLEQRLEQHQLAAQRERAKYGCVAI